MHVNNSRRNKLKPKILQSGSLSPLVDSRLTFTWKATYIYPVDFPSSLPTSYNFKLASTAMVCPYNENTTIMSSSYSFFKSACKFIFGDFPKVLIYNGWTWVLRVFWSKPIWCHSNLTSRILMNHKHGDLNLRFHK